MAFLEGGIDAGKGGLVKGWRWGSGSHTLEGGKGLSHEFFLECGVFGTF